jgi:hypothetical protein
MHLCAGLPTSYIKLHALQNIYLLVLSFVLLSSWLNFCASKLNHNFSLQPAESDWSIFNYGSRKICVIRRFSKRTHWLIIKSFSHSLIFIYRQLVVQPESYCVLWETYWKCLVCCWQHWVKIGVHMNHMKITGCATVHALVSYRKIAT